MDGLPYVPTSSEVSINDSVELWRFFLELRLCTPDVDRLRFWFDLMKHIYLPVFAYHLTEQMSITPGLPMRKIKRFQSFPPPLCEALASGLAKCLRTAEDHGGMYDVLCDEENLNLLMLLCRDMCHLPIQYALTTSRVIERFREFFLVRILVSYSKPCRSFIL